MLNQVVLVGRLTSKSRLLEKENGKKYLKITLAVPRAYKNEAGAYDTDFIDVILWANIAENANEWCNIGDLIGIKGRIEAKLIEKEIEDSEYNKIKKETNIIAERVTFLSSRKTNEGED